MIVNVKRKFKYLKWVLQNEAGEGGDLGGGGGAPLTVSQLSDQVNQLTAKLTELSTDRDHWKKQADTFMTEKKTTAQKLQEYAAKEEEANRK